MIKNYLIIARQNILNEWKHFKINILGLSLGLLGCFIILLFASFEYGLGKFNKDSKEFYFVSMRMEEENAVFLTPEASAPMGPMFKERLSEISNFSRFGAMGLPDLGNETSFSVKEQGTNKSINQDNIYYGDANLLSFLSVEMKEGDRENCLKESFTVAISESVKMKIFGKDKAIGKSIVIDHALRKTEIEDEARVYTVTGVFKDLPARSSIQIDILGSMATCELRAEESKQSGMDSWWNLPFFTTLVKLEHGAELKELEFTLRSIIEEPLRTVEELWETKEYPVLISSSDFRSTKWGFIEEKQIVLTSGE